MRDLSTLPFIPVTTEKVCRKAAQNTADISENNNPYAVPVNSDTRATPKRFKHTKNNLVQENLSCFLFGFIAPKIRTNNEDDDEINVTNDTLSKHKAA